jgi:hypothetical protein
MSLRARALVMLCLAVPACESELSDKPDTAGTPDTADDPEIDSDGDGFSADTDCDDDDASVHPEADEVCNAQDDDCDELIDDTDPDLVGGSEWPADNDGDGYLSEDPADVVMACEAPPGEPGDCDDSDPAVSPGAPENDDADHHDENCNGWADETSANFADATFFLAEGPMNPAPQALGDLDGDGVDDFTPDGDHVYFGGERLVGEYEVGATCALAVLGGTATAAGDQDGDGLGDVWVQSDELYLVVDLPSLQGQSVSASSVASAWTAAEGGTVLGGAAGDFDGDGVLDLGVNVFDYYWFFSTAYVLPGGSMGELDPGLALGAVGGPYDLMIQSAVTPDLDGDGLGELLTYDAATLALWPGGTTPSPAHSQAERRVSVPLWWLQDTADIDGDGFVDLIGCDDANERCYVLRERDLPAGDSSIEDVAWLVLPGLMRLVAIDLNGDGRTDLVGANRHAAEGAGMIYLYDGASLPGDGSLEPEEAIGRWRGEAEGAELGWKLDNVGDVDADGYEDLVVASNYPPSGVGGEAYLVYGGPPTP